MTTLAAMPDNKEILSFLCQASEYGNLGLFVGAGFSKAVLNRDGKEIGLSWGELLEKGAKELGVDYQSLQKTGISFAEIATLICERFAEQNHISYQRALTKLKRKFAILTSWYPKKAYRDQYSNYLSALDPNWIVTTNYDLVLESLLTGKCLPLGPFESMHAPKGMTPIYHLHGIRSNPDSLIIAQEDYVSLLRPNEYRQIKLALTLKESTVLLLGYGLGDVNVLTALDWSKNVFSTDTNHYPNEVIQVIRKPNPVDTPYRDRNGIVIIEIAELDDFFEEFLDAHQDYQRQKRQRDKTVRSLVSRLQTPDDTLIDRFIDDAGVRAEILQDLACFPAAIIASFESFLNKVLDQAWLRAKAGQIKQAYQHNLAVTLDILTTLPLSQLPPALLETLAFNLEKLGKHVDSDDIARTLKPECHLDEPLVQELLSIAQQHHYKRLFGLLDRQQQDDEV